MLAGVIAKGRAQRGWSLVELATRSALPPQKVRRAEAGVGSIKTVEALLSAMSMRFSLLPTADSLGRQLTLARARAQLSVSSAAALAGLSHMTIRAIETGQASIDSLDRYLAAVTPASRLVSGPRASWDTLKGRRGDDQFTPADFLQRIVGVFGQIDLDPAWHPASPVQAFRTFSLAQDQNGLTEQWSGNLIWLNPPYSQLLRWLRKADAEWSSGRARTIVSLCPARTDSTYFHDRIARVADIYLLRRRLRFVQLDGKPGNQAPFALMLVCFGASGAQLADLQASIEGLWIRRPQK